MKGSPSGSKIYQLNAPPVRLLITHFPSRQGSICSRTSYIFPNRKPSKEKEWKRSSESLRFWLSPCETLTKP